MIRVFKTPIYFLCSFSQGDAYGRASFSKVIPLGEQLCETAITQSITKKTLSITKKTHKYFRVLTLNSYYKGKTVEIVGEKEVFGQRIAWVRIFGK